MAALCINSPRFSFTAQAGENLPPHLHLLLYQCAHRPIFLKIDYISQLPVNSISALLLVMASIDHMHLELLILLLHFMYSFRLYLYIIFLILVFLYRFCYHSTSRSNIYHRDIHLFPYRYTNTTVYLYSLHYKSPAGSLLPGHDAFVFIWLYILSSRFYMPIIYQLQSKL